LLIPSIAGNTLDARQQENFFSSKGFYTGDERGGYCAQENKKKEISTWQIAGVA
jgi:hypothetical protein